MTAMDAWDARHQRTRRTARGTRRGLLDLRGSDPDRQRNSCCHPGPAPARYVLDHLVIGIDHPETGLDTYIHRPLG